MQLHAAEGLHRHDHGGDAGAVVKGLEGGAVVHQAREGDAEADRVAHAHEGLDLLLGQADVHRKVAHLRGLVRAVGQVRGLDADDAVERLTAKHRHLAAGEYSGVKRTKVVQADEAVVLDGGHQQAHLIHVRADEHAGTAAAHCGADVPQLVDAHIVGILAKLLRDARGDRALHARIAGQGADFL